MQQVLVLFAVLAMGFVSAFDPGLRVKFETTLRPGTDAFYEMPVTRTKAIEMKWTKMDRPSSPMPSLEMFCPIELNICVMYDPVTECIAGIQVAVPENTAGMPYDWKTQGFVSWTPPAKDDGESTTYMTKHMYFVTEESLSRSDEERLNNAGECKALQQDAVWLSGFNQELIKVGTKTDGIVDAGFTKQNCIPWMGTHYFYKMSKSTVCSASTLLNWFVLVDSGNLIGCGLLLPGEVYPVEGQRFLFERPASAAVKLILKDRPQCLDKLSENPTFTTMHIYFISKPWNVGCWPFGK